MFFVFKNKYSEVKRIILNHSLHLFIFKLKDSFILYTIYLKSHLNMFIHLKFYRTHTQTSQKRHQF